MSVDNEITRHGWYPIAKRGRFSATFSNGSIHAQSQGATLHGSGFFEVSSANGHTHRIPDQGQGTVNYLNDEFGKTWEIKNRKLVELECTNNTCSQSDSAGGAGESVKSS